ncbi:MAG: hypothetical protein NT040_08615 [Bacteroidetes bacterium]|nr:hypothetical protein [Bacteroidota bacterium]
MKRNTYFFSFTLILLSVTFRLSAQLAVSTNGSAPDASAMLDVISRDKGFLIPRMTKQQIQAIVNPADGLLVFCMSNKKFYAFRSGSNVWREISYGSSMITQSCYCGYEFTDQRDGKKYRTVMARNQCWMAENLNLGHPKDGNVEQRNDTVLEKHCYGNFEENCNGFGGLYQWHEMMQYVKTPGVQGICPAGWHLPADAEWTTLISGLGGGGEAGGKMKLTDLWKAPNTGATNSSGFNAMPGGFRDTNGFDKLTENTYFWSSTENGDSAAFARELGYNTGAVNRIALQKRNSISVRCVANNQMKK